MARQKSFISAPVCLNMPDLKIGLPGTFRQDSPGSGGVVCRVFPGALRHCPLPMLYTAAG